MDTNSIILIVIAALVIFGFTAWMISRRQHTVKLREKYGSEYDYTVNQAGDRRRAEAELDEREERVKALEIRSLAAEERDQFAEEWRRTQAEFVDKPAESVKNANKLIKELMMARGFPVVEFGQRAADISVFYPDVVSNYRAAHEIAKKNEQGEANTEELRQAMVFYRSLFGELLETGEVQLKERII